MPPPLPQQAPQGQAPGGWAPVTQPAGPASPVPEPTPRRAAFVPQDIPVVTGETVPGLQIEAVVGVVVGVTTRSRDVKVGPDTIALLAQARQDAVAALVTMAVEAGADAVVGLRFDGGKVAESLSEVTAYGTAVTVVGDAAEPARAAEDEESAQAPEPGSGEAPTEVDSEAHAADPVPMDDPDPEDPFGEPAPRDADSIHDQQLRETQPDWGSTWSGDGRSG